jgi:hypothetical protein
LEGLTLCPPFRPASAASLGFCEKLRFSFGTLSPPFRAIARCFSRSIEAKPRVEVKDFLCISVAGAIVSSFDLKHKRKQRSGGDEVPRLARENMSKEVYQALNDGTS